MVSKEQNKPPLNQNMRPNIGTLAVGEDISREARREALQTLVTLRVFTPLSGLDTYHGRVARIDDPEWTIDPNYGSGEAKPRGRVNANTRTTLYTANADDAKEFGQYRASFDVEKYAIEVFETQLRQKDPSGEKEINAHYEYYQLPEEERHALWFEAAKKFRVELHKISSHDPEALVANFGFDSTKLDTEQNSMLHGAVDVLLAEPFETYTQGLVTNTEQLQIIAGALHKVKAEIEPDKEGFSGAVIFQAAQESGELQRTIVEVAAALNAKQILSKSISRAVVAYLESNHEDLTFERYAEDASKLVPISIKLIRSFLDAAHVIGSKDRTRSSSLGKSINVVSFFNLQAIHNKDS